jgi:Domain of unknown function (DUF3291)
LKWFEKRSAPHLTLWWIPAGHIPSVEEARDRLEFLKIWGESPLAFSIRTPYSEEPSAEAAQLELNFDRCEFASASNTPNGDCTRETNFHYRRRGDRLWVMYGGGNVRFGSLVAVGDQHGRPDMRYQHADATGRLRERGVTRVPGRARHQPLELFLGQRLC